MDRDKIYYVLFEQQKDFADEKLKIIPRELTPKIISFCSPFLVWDRRIPRLLP